MVKALITFEGVGHVLLPGIDVAQVSRKHVRHIFINQFSPVRLVHDQLRAAPDLVDALAKMPLLVTEGLRVLEQSTREPRESPFAGLPAVIIGGFALLAGTLLLALGGPWPVWTLLYLMTLVLLVRGGRT